MRYWRCCKTVMWNSCAFSCIGNVILKHFVCSLSEIVRYPQARQPATNQPWRNKLRNVSVLANFHTMPTRKTRATSTTATATDDMANLNEAIAFISAKLDELLPISKEISCVLEIETRLDNIDRYNSRLAKWFRRWRHWNQRQQNRRSRRGARTPASMVSRKRPARTPMPLWLSWCSRN